MNLAITQQAQKNFLEAEQNYLKALELRTTYPDCEYNLGNLYLKTGQLDLAEMRFRSAISR